MKVTFLITNYNYGAYIPCLMESIANLDNPEGHLFNLIIGDDASTDGSRMVINDTVFKYKNLFSDIFVFFNESNGGKNNLLNILIPKVESEFTIIVDADDWLCAEFLTVQYEAFMKYAEDKNFGFIYSDCTLCNQRGDPIGKGKSTDFSLDLLKTHSYIPQTCLIRTQALKSCLPLDESIRVGTKHHKWNKVCSNGWYGVYLQRPLFFYRMHEKNISSIGKKVLGEQQNDVKDRILYGYWPTAKTGS